MTFVFLFIGVLLALATDFSELSWFLVVVSGLVGAGLDVRAFLKNRTQRKETVKKIAGLEASVASLQDTVKHLDTRISSLLAEKTTEVEPSSPEALVSEATTSATANEGVASIPSEQTVPTAPVGLENENAAETQAQDAEKPYIPEPPPKRTGKSPSPVDRLLTFFTGGNTVARVGIVLLTIGLGFLVQFAAREGWFPVQLRLAGAGLVGVALIALGWRLRVGRTAYALSLQGGGVGVMYLTIFAAIQLYSLVPNTLGFGLLVLVAVAAAVLAVLQNAMALAVLGALGGFLAPFFAAGEGGSHVVLFSYYLVLNIGILLVAWRKAWRPLNMVGFVGTFVAGTLWGGLNYTPDLFATTEPFLILFFFMYLALAVLYALRQPPKLRGLMDSSLVFGLPAVVFGLQVALVRRFELGVALTALGFAAVYLGLAFLLYKRAPKELGVLAEAFTALGIIFTALVLPFALDASWASAGWALGAAGLVWIGVRQNRVWLRLFGLGWHLLALWALGLQIVAYTLLDFLMRLLGNVSVNTLSLDTLASALSLLFSAYMLRRADDLKRWENLCPALYMWLGLGVWTLFGALQTDRVAGVYETPAMLLFFTVTALLCSVLGKQLKWRGLSNAALSLPLIAALYLLNMFDAFLRWFSAAAAFWFSFVVWTATVLTTVFVLRRAKAKRWLLEGLSALGTWILGVTVIVHSLGFGEVFLASDSWGELVIALPFTLLVWWLATPNLHGASWLHPDVKRWLLYGVAPLASLLWLLGFAFNSAPPFGTEPLPYVPLLNPADLFSAFALLTLIRFVMTLRRVYSLARFWRRSLSWALIALGLFWTSAIIARTVHYWLGVPYTFDALFDSNVLQTSLSIFWSLFALLAMLLARRLSRRTPWLVGAGLLGIVVLKLFLVELAGVSAVARVVSFIGVGLLLLVVGYVAPLPPAQTTDEVPA